MSDYISRKDVRAALSGLLKDIRENQRGEALVYRCRCTFTQVIVEFPSFGSGEDCPLGEVKE